MAFDIFGWRIRKRSEDDERQKALITVVPSQDSDGSGTIVAAGPGGGYMSSTYYNLDFNTNSEIELINKYREMSLTSEIESAIDEIVNETFYVGDNDSPVSIVTDDLPYSDKIKDLIREEFDEILSLLNFNENAYELFKRWYVDGRIYFNVVIDGRNPQEGIQELRYIDPRRIKKVKEIREEQYRGGVRVPVLFDEWFVYNSELNNGTVKLPLDSVSFATSGLVDEKNGSMILSYLHSAIKPFNQLRMLEDATVIYNIARAPERRVFKIDVGNLPKIKAEQFINEIMNRYKNRVAYDSTTGDLRDDTRTLSMLEDFFLPTREGGRGTDITTLPGGNTEFGIAQVDQFQNKLYRALRIPVGRTKSDTTFNTGRATEIAREEVKFSKFIQRLRLRFSMLFTDLLRKQLILKNIITPNDWELNFKNKIYYDYKQDSHFLEYNEAEILARRMELAQQADSLGYYSKNYINKKILRLTDEEIDEIKADKEAEKKRGKRSEPDMGIGGGDEMGDFTPTTIETPITPEPPDINLEPTTPEIPAEPELATPPTPGV